MNEGRSGIFVAGVSKVFRRVALLTLVLPVLTIGDGSMLPAERLQPGGSPPATYEVATIKLSDPWMVGGGFRVRGQRLESVNTSLKGLILFAYELQSAQMLNAPDWADKDKFDITMLYSGESFPNDAQCKAMVRQVLAERFGLKFHREAKEMPVYTLVVGKGGPKLDRNESDPNGLPGLHFSKRGALNARNVSMQDLTGELQRSVLGRPVLDRTGLAGRWDFTLEWTPDASESMGGPDNQKVPVVSGKPELFTAIQEQLGLKLESTKAPAGTLVIEGVSKPSDN